MYHAVQLPGTVLTLVRQLAIKLLNVDYVFCSQVCVAALAGLCCIDFWHVLLLVPDLQTSCTLQDSFDECMHEGAVFAAMVEGALNVSLCKQLFALFFRVLTMYIILCDSHGICLLTDAQRCSTLLFQYVE